MSSRHSELKQTLLDVIEMQGGWITRRELSIVVGYHSWPYLTLYALEALDELWDEGVIEADYFSHYKGSKCWQYRKVEK